ncbi:MAG: hypothetical protein ACXVA4_13985 [Ktedonobacterales bacterium]
MSHQKSGVLAREDLLVVSISLVKGDRRNAGAAQFVSDVAATFEALSGEMRRIPDTNDLFAASAFRLPAGRYGVPRFCPYGTLEPDCNWPMAG